MNCNSFCSWYIDDDDEEQILQKLLPSFPNIYKEIDPIFLFHFFKYTNKNIHQELSPSLEVSSKYHCLFTEAWP